MIDIINKKCEEINTKNFPYPVKIFKNFLDKNFFLNLQNDFPDITKLKNKIRMDNDLTYPDDEYIKLLDKSIYYKNFHNFIYSKYFVEYILNIFRNDLNKLYKNCELKINPFMEKISSSPKEIGRIYNLKDLDTKKKIFFYPRLDLGVGNTNYGKITGGGGPHIDKPQRLISILFYLGGFDTMEGGEHIFFNRSKNKINIHKAIEIKPNLLIASVQTNNAIHSVNPVRFISGYRKAFYIAISCNKHIWNIPKITLIDFLYNGSRLGLNNFQTKISWNLKKIFKHIYKVENSKKFDPKDLINF